MFGASAVISNHEPSRTATVWSVQLRFIHSFIQSSPHFKTNRAAGNKKKKKTTRRTNKEKESEKLKGPLGAITQANSTKTQAEDFLSDFNFLFTQINKLRDQSTQKINPIR